MSSLESRHEHADGQRDPRSIVKGDRAVLGLQVERQDALRRALAAKDVSVETRASLERQIGQKCTEIAASAVILDEVARRLQR